MAGMINNMVRNYVTNIATEDMCFCDIGISSV